MTLRDEFDGIVVALDALLAAIKDDNERHRGDLTTPRSAGSMDWTWEETELELSAYDLIRNPVGQALRNAIKLLGERLHERGGIGLMREALDGACTLNAADEGWREAILDRLWSGIGAWEA